MTWLDSDEETLLVDKLYYQDKEFQKKEKKYNHTVIIENPLPILPAPERTTVGARDLLQNWPYLPGEDEIPSATELQALGIILEGYSIFTRESATDWVRIPVNVRALQEQALRTELRRRRREKITTVWDTYSKLPFHQQSAIMQLLGTIHNLDKRRGPSLTGPGPEGPALLNLDVKKHRRERFLDRLRSVTPFYGHGAPRATLFIVVARARDARDRFGSPYAPPSPYGLPPVHPSRAGPPAPPPPDPYWPGYDSDPDGPIVIRRSDRGDYGEPWIYPEPRVSPVRVPRTSSRERSRHYSGQNRHHRSRDNRDSYSEDPRRRPSEPYSFYPSRRVASPDVIDLSLPDKHSQGSRSRRAKSRRGQDGSSDYVDRRQQLSGSPPRRRRTTDTVHFDDYTIRTHNAFNPRENELVLRSQHSYRPHGSAYHSRTSTFNQDNQITPYLAPYSLSRSSTGNRPWGTIRPSGAVTVYRPRPTNDYNNSNHPERPTPSGTYEEDSDDFEDARPPTKDEKIDVANWYLRMWTTALDKVRERVKNRYYDNSSGDDSYRRGRGSDESFADSSGRDSSRDRSRERRWRRRRSSMDEDRVEIIRRDSGGEHWVVRRERARERARMEEARERARMEEARERGRMEEARERGRMEEAREMARMERELERIRERTLARSRNDAVRTSQATTVGQNANANPASEFSTAVTGPASASAPLHARVEDATERNGNGNGGGLGNRNGNEDAADRLERGLSSSTGWTGRTPPLDDFGGYPVTADPGVYPAPPVSEPSLQVLEPAE